MPGGLVSLWHVIYFVGTGQSFAFGLKLGQFDACLQAKKKIRLIKRAVFQILRNVLNKNACKMESLASLVKNYHDKTGPKL